MATNIISSDSKYSVFTFNLNVHRISSPSISAFGCCWNRHSLPISDYIHWPVSKVQFTLRQIILFVEWISVQSVRRSDWFTRSTCSTLLSYVNFKWRKTPARSREGYLDIEAKPKLIIFRVKFFIRHNKVQNSFDKTNYCWNKSPTK